MAEAADWLGFEGFTSSGALLYVAADASGAVNPWIVGFDGAPAVKLTHGSGGLAPEYFRSVP